MKKSKKKVEQIPEFEVSDVERGTEDVSESMLKRYPKAFKKVASYSGTTRIMKCQNGQCGEFDNIINIYVDPDKGMMVQEYESPKNRIINTAGHDDEVLPSNVVHKNLTFWGGKPKVEYMEYRKKKSSKQVKRHMHIRKVKSR